MPDELSDKTNQQSPIDISAKHRLAMIGLGYIPCAHCSLVVWLLAAAIFRWGAAWGPLFWSLCALATLYLLPPLAVFPLRIKRSITATHYPMESAEFLRWWYVAQWQVVFNRVPLLEEILRLIPGLYSTWLRLWGASIGSFVYWSPGLSISDRPFLEIGDRTVIGLDTKLYAHFLAKSPTGTTDLYLSPITIGHDALIGGCGLLTAGVQVSPGEQTPAVRPMAPFSRFTGGRSIRTTRFHQKEEHDV